MDEKIKKILEEVKEQNEKLIGVFKQRGSLLAVGERFEIESYSSCVEAFLSIASILISISDATGINVDIPKIQEHLEEFVTALENNDSILTIDIIEYDLLPILEDLQKQLDTKVK